MRVFYLVVKLSLLLLLSSCTKEVDSGCGIADEITYLNEFLVDGEIYYLYERRAGLQGKISFIEFYGSKPDFDQCGESSEPRLSQVDVEDFENDPVRIVIRDLKVSIEYGDQPFSSPDLSSMPIEVR